MLDTLKATSDPAMVGLDLVDWYVWPLVYISITPFTSAAWNKDKINIDEIGGQEEALISFLI